MTAAEICIDSEQRALLDSDWVGMRRVSYFWFLLLIFSLQAWHCISAAEPAPAPVSVSFSQPDQAWSRSSSSVLSDFDGDGTPDLAIGRFDGQNYNIEIQLSTGRTNTLLGSGQIEPGLRLLVCDVDLDNDQDLVLVNYTSLLPLAIWLNDGKAEFKPGWRWSWLNLITTENRSSVDPKGFSASPVSISEHYRLPLNRSVTGFLAARLQSRNSVIPESQTLRLLIFPYHPSLRGPPPSC